MNFPSSETVERLRREYPVGARVELLRMDDVQAPPIGTLGTVTGVDDTGSIMVHWDNGSSLNVVYGEDLCRTLLPDETPGSVLTLVLENGEWKRVGPIPKIDVNKIPKFQMDMLCRTLLESVRRFYEDPENVRKYEEWKKNRENGDSPNDEGGKQV